MLDAHQLRIFAAVAENLSFTRAAEQLLLTQSAVSHQISRLERTVGSPLLQRDGRQVRLTDAGKELLTHARPVFSALINCVPDPEKGS